LRFKLKHLQLSYASIDPDQNNPERLNFLDPAELSQNGPRKLTTPPLRRARGKDLSQD
jgi:hypothetical protein